MADLKGLAEALRAPSIIQDGHWFHPKAIYATKPRGLLDQAATIIERLDRETLKAAIRPVLDQLTEPGTRSLDGMTGDLADAIISHLQGGEDA